MIQKFTLIAELGQINGNKREETIDMRPEHSLQKSDQVKNDEEEYVRKRTRDVRLDDKREMPSSSDVDNGDLPKLIPVTFRSFHLRTDF